MMMRSPRLSLEEQNELARRWRASGDVKALNRLVESHVAYAIAYVTRYGTMAERDDLIQEAQLGLVEAARRFDPDRGVPFTAYCRFWIKAFTLRAIAASHSVSLCRSALGVRTAYHRAPSMRARLEAAGLPATDEHVAAALGVTSRDVADVEAARRVPLSFDAEPENARSLHDRLGDTFDLEQLFEDAKRRELVRAQLGRLSPRLRMIVEWRMNGMSLGAIGDHLGLSRERIRQLELRAMKGIRRGLESSAATRALATRSRPLASSYKRGPDKRVRV
jgi:RNA polymerase sigma factor (sigma-70 family)